MTVDPRIERLTAQRDAGELTAEQFEAALAQLRADAPTPPGPPASDAPEQRWLGQQAAWPSQTPAAPWQSGSAPPSPYGAPSQWQGQQPPPPAWPPQQPSSGWSQGQQPAWPQQAPGAAPQPPWPQQPPQGAPPAHPAPHGWQQPQQAPAAQPGQWQQPQGVWAQQQPQWQQPPWAQPQQAPMVPAGVYAAPGYAPPMPQTYMTQAILATMFCCVPLGVVAIVKASQVSSAWQTGDYALAQQRSGEARSWVNWSVLSSLLMGGLWFFFVLMAGIGGAI